MADIIQETTRSDQNQTWEVYVDGLSTKQGAGAGVLMVNPEKDEFEFAIRYFFKTLKNEAEYQAMIQGIKLAERVGATRLIVHSDLQLIMQQVNGKYEVRDERMKEYVG